MYQYYRLLSLRHDLEPHYKPTSQFAYAKSMMGRYRNDPKTVPLDKLCGHKRYRSCIRTNPSHKELRRSQMWHNKALDRYELSVEARDPNAASSLDYLSIVLYTDPYPQNRKLETVSPHGGFLPEDYFTDQQDRPGFYLSHPGDMGPWVYTSKGARWAAAEFLNAKRLVLERNHIPCETTTVRTNDGILAQLTSPELDGPFSVEVVKYPF